MILTVDGSVPNDSRVIAVRAAAAGAVLAGLGAVHVPRPATLCPLRAMTGVPCPVCGTTTALARLGRLDALGALAANPFAVLGLIALVLAPLLWPRWIGTPAAARVACGAVVVAGAWAWQLNRFDVLL